MVIIKNIIIIDEIEESGRKNNLCTAIRASTVKTKFIHTAISASATFT